MPLARVAPVLGVALALLRPAAGLRAQAPAVPEQGPEDEDEATRTRRELWTWQQRQLSTSALRTTPRPPAVAPPAGLCGELRGPSTEEYNLWRPNATWFGQELQDQQLSSVLRNDTGFFVEAGAADGETNSNTLHYERQGWSGLLVEPFPATFELLLGKHRKSHSYQGALSMTGQVGEMYLKVRDCAGYEGDGECSRVVAEPNANRVRIPIAPLDQLLACLGRSTVDFWSLDVEGAEDGILESFPFHKIEVGLMLIEANNNRFQTARIRRAMTSAGFRRCGGTKFDVIFVNPRYYSKRGLDTPSEC